MKAGLLDTETTDLIKSKYRPLKDQPHITEFFGLSIEATAPEVRPAEWIEIGHYHGLFNPGIPLSAEVQKITGLTDDMLKDCPRFESRAAEIKAWIEAHDIVVAHNLGFDRAIIDFEMARAGLKIDWSQVRLICTVEGTEHLFHRRLKLIELHEHLFGEPFPNAHRAENDVRPMTRCFIELWNRGVFG